MSWYGLVYSLPPNVVGLGFCFEEAESAEVAFWSRMPHVHDIAHQYIEEVLHGIPDHNHGDTLAEIIPFPLGKEDAEAVHSASWHNLGNWSISNGHDCLSAWCPDGSAAVVILPARLHDSKAQP